MNLLLDTHVWLSSYLEPHKLSSDAHQAIADGHKLRFLSPVSVWETVLLLEGKKIALHDDFGEWFEPTE